jgi:miniconductance mechanosensitive channel
MVGIGDWIEMPKYGADGDVINVTLNTVKVQNWDKTITTIPAYALISDSFKHWRGMSESGGRRIKRSISIDMDSIRFCTPEMLDRFESFGVISDYIKSKRAEIEVFNPALDADISMVVKRRNLTSVGTFRAYIESYLRSHPKIHTDMTFLVRQLPPGEHGLPIEIYVFSNDQDWINYEGIHSDIFDHLLAVVPMFDLAVHQKADRK